MDEDSDKRERAGTLELKGEGQGFTLRRYAIVLQKPITRAIDAYNCSNSGSNGLFHCPLLRKNVKMNLSPGKLLLPILLTVSIHFGLPNRQVFRVIF
jgi:hypothetical protein